MTSKSRAAILRGLHAQPFSSGPMLPQDQERHREAGETQEDRQQDPRQAAIALLDLSCRHHAIPPPD